MRDEDRSAVLYTAAAVPRLLISLGITYLKVRRKAVKAERQFYRTLIANGMEKRMALELAAEYSSPTSISFWMREFVGQGARFKERPGHKE